MSTATAVGKSIDGVRDVIVLIAPAINPINTFDKKDTVSPKKFDRFKKTSDNATRIELPAKSVVKLEVKIEGVS